MTTRQWLLFGMHEYGVSIQMFKYLSFRGQGFLFHMSGSGPIILGYGTEFDYIRPGVSMFGVNGSGLSHSLHTKVTHTVRSRNPSLYDTFRFFLS